MAYTIQASSDLVTWETLGTRTAKRKNPFTGKMQSVPVDDGLTDAERAAVRKLLKSAGASKPDEFGCYAVEFKDGGSAEVFASELGGSEQCDGLMVSLQGITSGLVKFLWELCRAGNMAATPIMEDEVVHALGAVRTGRPAAALAPPRRRSRSPARVPTVGRRRTPWRQFPWGLCRRPPSPKW